MELNELKQNILEQIRAYSEKAHSGFYPQNKEERPFTPGTDTVPYAGRVFDSNEVVASASALLDFWLTLGKEGDGFEKELSTFMGTKGTVLTNSGSSANLLAAAALTSYRLGDRRLHKGDEVITVAAGFPTTVAPLIQQGLVPVFIDNDEKSLNARISQLEEAYRPGKTKAVFMAHTLGNPFDLATVTAFCEKHNLLLVEDNCDALGSTYDGKLTGTFGDLSTQSFYPPHHLTLGEGGAINFNKDPKWRLILESFRDWGRDCWCPSGKDNTCKKRFDQKFDGLPEGYDHKFVYTHLGYNLKPLDLQAAIGRQQIQKLPGFIKARSENWDYLRKGMAGLEEYFEFQLPTHATGWKNGEFTWDPSGHKTQVSWFGFMLRVRDGGPFKKPDFVRFLDSRKIGNRMLFGGNLVKQPAFQMLLKDNPNAFRVIGDLQGADAIMRQALFIGVYPGLSRRQMDYMIESVHDFIQKVKN